MNHAIEWVQAQQALTPDKPFFVYLSFGATHAPHHVPPEWSDKYKGKFDMGWDKLRETTLANQKKLGVVPQDCQLTARSKGIPAWADLTDDAKKVATRLMEIYAGFAEHTDHYAGVFLDALEEMGVLDNTLVFYIAGDNGASAEGRSHGTYNEMLTLNYRDDTVENILAHYDDLGTVAAYNHYPVGWAHAMDTPYQWTKQVASHWGGTRNGMAVRWPKGFKAKGQVRNQFHHVIDVAPTILEAAGLPQPVQVHGVTQKPIEGVSMKYTFDDAKAPDQHVTQYFEMFGNRGIYHQGWSAITLHTSPLSKKPGNVGGRRLGAVRRQHGLEPGRERGGQVSRQAGRAEAALHRRGGQVQRLPAGRPPHRAHEPRHCRAARPAGRTHRDDVLSGHGPTAGEHRPQRQEQVAHHHGRHRGAGKGERRDHRAGRPLRRLDAIHERRGAQVRATTTSASRNTRSSRRSRCPPAG